MLFSLPPLAAVGHSSGRISLLKVPPALEVRSSPENDDSLENELFAYHFHHQKQATLIDIKTTSSYPHASIPASASSSSCRATGEGIYEHGASTNTATRSPETQEALELRFRAIRKQLKRCSHRHQGTCQARLQLSNSDTEIYLINVQKMCLVKQTVSNTGYLTLSYVWGSIPQYTLTRDRIAALLVEGGIDDVLDRLPRVIRDGITVARLLRATFLWVDSLCIVQDDAELKHHQIESMAHIYNGSFLTIIVPEAEDSSSRLPCLGTFETADHYKKMLKKRPPSSYRALAAHLNGSKYGSRAWTYQERLLSWRCLYCFTDQVVLRCSQSIWYRGVSDSEEILDPSARLLNLPYNMDLNDTTSIEFRYATVVQQYSRKELRYVSDVPAAFAGIANALQSWHACDFRFGIPQASEYLYPALMWFPDVSSAHYAGTRRRLADDIPSWSWMGWASPIWYPILRQSYPVFEGQAILDGVPLELVGKLTWREMSKSFAPGQQCLHHPGTGKILHLDVTAIRLGSIQPGALPPTAVSRDTQFWQFSYRDPDFAPFRLYNSKGIPESWTMYQDKVVDSKPKTPKASMPKPIRVINERVGMIFGLSPYDLSAMAESRDNLDMLILSASTTTRDYLQWRMFDLNTDKVEVLNFILVRSTAQQMSERVAAGRILSSALKDYTLSRMVVRLI